MHQEMHTASHTCSPPILITNLYQRANMWNQYCLSSLPTLSTQNEHSAIAISGSEVCSSHTPLRFTS